MSNRAKSKLVEIKQHVRGELRVDGVCLAYAYEPGEIEESEIDPRVLKLLTDTGIVEKGSVR